MRKIKFRGKRVDNGEWIYSFGIVCLPDVGVQLMSFSDESTKESLVFEWIDVIPETIGQYTGLKDKNGNEIYEGDLVPVRMTFEVDNFKECSYIETSEDGKRTFKKCSTVNSTVEFDSGTVVFKYENKVKELWIASVDKDKWEVIGNIHEKH